MSILLINHRLRSHVRNIGTQPTLLLSTVPVARGSVLKQASAAQIKTYQIRGTREMYLVVCHCNDRQTSLSWLHLICHSSCFVSQRLHSSWLHCPPFSVLSQNARESKPKKQRKRDNIHVKVTFSRIKFSSGASFALKYLHAWLDILTIAAIKCIFHSWLSTVTPMPSSAVSLYEQCGFVCVLGGQSRLEHAQPCQRGRGAGGVRGLWTLTIWPLGEGMVSSLAAFVQCRTIGT